MRTTVTVASVPRTAVFEQGASLVSDESAESYGEPQFLQPVRCVVTGHRHRFGVEVELLSPQPGRPAFIDFINLTDEREHVTPDRFPPVGTVLDAVYLCVLPNGEVRISL
ncbi:hypothetical protein [Streptomyces xanthophaeus]